MKTKRNLWIVLACVAVGAWAIAATRHETGGVCCPGVMSLTAMAAQTSTNASAKAGVPRLVDLGADKCIPCKKMAPILAKLQKDYAGKLEVEFIDVWKNPDASKAYGIQLIPTQIFYGADGKELFRHEGFFSEEDILAKWKELGVEFKAPSSGAK
ncbi:MAG TPA: thioredoxin family protein, partial [Bacillota bacterium]|nr:thioredoxin family protein [Bacillota bacterium]